MHLQTRPDQATAATEGPAGQGFTQCNLPMPTLKNLVEMGRNSNFNEDSLKAGWLAKRSQLRSRFPAFATSYKERWFVLTRNALIYYDSQEPARRKEKGRLLVKEVKLVEKVRICYGVSLNLLFFHEDLTFGNVV